MANYHFLHACGKQFWLGRHCAAWAVAYGRLGLKDGRWAGATRGRVHQKACQKVYVT